MQYLGKNVLITGSRRGVGHILCKHFLEQGATVIGLNRHADDAFSAPNYHPLVVDIGQPDSLTPCFDQIRHEFGHLDIVINNAGVLTSQYAMIMAATAARAMLETSTSLFLGKFILSKSFLSRTVPLPFSKTKNFALFLIALARFLKSAPLSAPPAKRIIGLLKDSRSKMVLSGVVAKLLS